MSESDKDRILAGIPWNRSFQEQYFELDLMDSAIFINETRNIGEISRKFFLFNSTFPFYIPPAFHAMDARAMRKTCPNGQYWAVASLFLLYNNPHTLFAWEKFGTQGSASNLEEKCMPSISTEMLQEVFPDSIPQCESAAHFFLDFSLLVQLPFKPVLLHQWLVAVYHDVLQIQTEVIEFYFIKFPLEEKTSVEALFQELYCLQDWLEKGFTWLKKRLNGKMELGHEDVDELNEVIKKITKFFKLWFDLRRPKNMKILKIDTAIDDTSIKMKPNENYLGLILNNRNFVYNLLWWKMPEEERDFFGYSLIASGKQDILDYFPFTPNYHYIEKLLKSISTNLLCLDENEMQSLRCNTEWKERAKKYDHRKEVAKLLRIQEKDRGILGDIFFATAKHDMKLAWLELVETTVKLTEKEMDLKTRFDLQEEMFDALGPEPFDDKSELPTGKPLRYSDFAEPLNLIDILRELRQSIGEPNRSPPEVFEDPLECMGKHFQERIQKLVIDTISAQYKFGKFEKEKDVGRDWQMGYLLSCFVASFLDLKENPEVRRKVKRWYMLFIHELIAEYEASRFQELNDVAVKEGMDGSSALYVLYHMKEPALLSSYFQTIERAFLAEMKGGYDVLQHLKKYHMFGVLYEVLEFAGEKTDLLSEPSILWMWQLLDFFRKMEKALRSCATDKSILKDPFSSKVTDDHMFQLTRLMWVVSANSNDFKTSLSNVSNTVELVNLILNPNSDPHCISEGLRTLILEQKILNNQFLLIAFDLALKNNDRNVEWCQIFKPTFSPFDIAFHSFLTKANDGQMWALREFASAFFKDDSTVSYKFASNKARVCYSHALSLIGEDGRVDLGKLDSPRWFFPIRMCGQCGLVKPQGKTFLLPFPCHECLNGKHRKHPDVMVFCSDECRGTAFTSHVKDHRAFAKYKSMKMFT